MPPKITQLKYTYINKQDNKNVSVLNLDEIPVPKDQIIDQQIVYLAPASKGGNHRHPRTEWFVAFGDVELVWLDADGKINKNHMNPDGQLLLIEVPPLLPHAVINRSNDQSAVLFEYSNNKINKTEKLKII